VWRATFPYARTILTRIGDMRIYSFTYYERNTRTSAMSDTLPDASARARDLLRNAAVYHSARASVIGSCFDLYIFEKTITMGWCRRTTAFFVFVFDFFFLFCFFTRSRLQRSHTRVYTVYVRAPRLGFFRSSSRTFSRRNIFFYARQNASPTTVLRITRNVCYVI